MKKIHFIGDLHFGDETIIKLENRPFQNSLSQTMKICELWNRVVSYNDDVYIVGDFVNINTITKEEVDIIKKLKGNIYLIRGNHDTEDDNYYTENFNIKKVIDTPILLDGFWIISHEPQYINKNFPYANVFAHVHNNPMYNTHSCRSYCVSADRINFTPIEFNEIKNTVMEDDLNQK